MKLVHLPETAEAFERRCEQTRQDVVRESRARALVLCRDCKTMHPVPTCPRCKAFREGRPWTHAELGTAVRA